MRQVFPSFSFSLPTLFCRNGLLYPLLFCCILDFSDSCPCVNNFPTNDHHCSLTNAPSVQFNCNWILNPKLQPLHIHMSHYLTDSFFFPTLWEHFICSRHQLSQTFYVLNQHLQQNLMDLSSYVWVVWIFEDPGYRGANFMYCLTLWKLRSIRSSLNGWYLLSVQEICWDLTGLLKLCICIKLALRSKILQAFKKSYLWPVAFLNTTVYMD
jgi:hypothetical protein